MSLLSLCYKYPALSAARSPTDHLRLIYLPSAESSDHVFFYPTITISRRADDEPGGGQSSICALHGMSNFITVH